MAMLAHAAPREKSPEAFRTISEVAVELDIPQHVLRFWESRFAQIRPVKRAGGRRYYRPEDIDLLRGIRSLLYREGFTIKGAQKIFRDKGLRYVAEIGRAAAPCVVEPLRPQVPQPPVVVDDTPRHARAVLVTLERAHAEPPAVQPEPQPAPVDEAQALAREERMRLEALLAELLQLKARLSEARA
jgi:DNA-binding transcriptional MerR regulator